MLMENICVALQHFQIVKEYPKIETRSRVLQGIFFKFRRHRSEDKERQRQRETRDKESVSTCCRNRVQRWTPTDSNSERNNRNQSHPHGDRSMRLPPAFIPLPSLFFLLVHEQKYCLRSKLFLFFFLLFLFPT